MRFFRPKVLGLELPPTLVRAMREKVWLDSYNLHLHRERLDEVFPSPLVGGVFYSRATIVAENLAWRRYDKELHQDPRVTYYEPGDEGWLDPKLLVLIGRLALETNVALSYRHKGDREPVVVSNKNGAGPSWFPVAPSFDVLYELLGLPWETPHQSSR